MLIDIKWNNELIMLGIEWLNWLMVYGCGYDLRLMVYVYGLVPVSKWNLQFNIGSRGKSRFIWIICWFIYYIGKMYLFSTFVGESE